MPDEKRPLILHPGSGLAFLKPQGGRIMTEMVSGALALSCAVTANLALIPRFRIGGHELCEPDCQQIVLWAKALEMDLDSFLERLMALPGDEIRQKDKTQFVNGRIIKLGWDLGLLPLKSFEWVEGLAIESVNFFVPNDYQPLARSLSVPLTGLLELDCSSMGLEELDLSKVSCLRVMSCVSNQLTSLDLSAVPQLRELYCDDNRFTSLDLSFVSQLTYLSCSSNQLKSLDLSAVLQLDHLDCSINDISSIDLSRAPNLLELSCSHNKIKILDLSCSPELRRLSCADNQLSSLDLSPVQRLTSLSCYQNPLDQIDVRPLESLNSLLVSAHPGFKLIKKHPLDAVKIRVIQRPDQKFTSWSTPPGLS